MKLPDENNIRIIETVTDDYGTARKFSDGTMIVTQKYEALLTTDSWDSWGSLYISSLGTPPNYPIEFIEKPYVTYSVFSLSNYDLWLTTRIGSGAASTKVSMGLQAMRASKPGTTISTEVDIIAIGKWK